MIPRRYARSPPPSGVWASSDRPLYKVFASTFSAVRGAKPCLLPVSSTMPLMKTSSRALAYAMVSGSTLITALTSLRFASGMVRKAAISASIRAAFAPPRSTPPAICSSSFVSHVSSLAGGRSMPPRMRLTDRMNQRSIVTGVKLPYRLLKNAPTLDPRNTAPYTVESASSEFISTPVNFSISARGWSASMKSRTFSHPCSATRPCSFARPSRISLADFASGTAASSGHVLVSFHLL